jgi:hypothetical protein
MTQGKTLSPEIIIAIEGIEHFMAETTGQKATAAEISDALGRYFVLHEIKEHILMLRDDEDE